MIAAFPAEDATDDEIPSAFSAISPPPSGYLTLPA
jgi:hypothetical protein